VITINDLFLRTKYSNLEVHSVSLLYQEEVNRRANVSNRRYKLTVRPVSLGYSVV